jgi:hypothetical protein
MGWRNGLTNIYQYVKTFKFGDTSNNSSFENDGTLLFTGNATVYNDIIIQGNQLLKPSINAPDVDNFINSNLQIYTFDGTANTEHLFGLCEMQHDYKEGSNIELHLHWIPTVAPLSQKVVKWQIYYNWANKTDTFSSGTLVSNTGTVETTDQWVHKYTSIATITGTGKKVGSVIAFQLFRNPTDNSDTYESDAGVLSVGIHYECDTCGSRQPLIK